jgi:hypothetical protein
MLCYVGNVILAQTMLPDFLCLGQVAAATGVLSHALAEYLVSDSFQPACIRGAHPLFDCATDPDKASCGECQRPSKRTFLAILDYFNNR